MNKCPHVSTLSLQRLEPVIRRGGSGDHTHNPLEGPWDRDKVCRWVGWDRALRAPTLLTDRGGMELQGTHAPEIDKVLPMACGVTNKGLVALAASCPGLCVWDISHRSAVRAEGVRARSGRGLPDGLHVPAGGDQWRLAPLPHVHVPGWRKTAGTWRKFQQGTPRWAMMA
eukprot:jgi/Mesvir1/215/Mv13559-RA.1